MSSVERCGGSLPGFVPGPGISEIGIDQFNFSRRESKGLTRLVGVLDGLGYQTTGEELLSLLDQHPLRSHSDPTPLLLPTLRSFQNIDFGPGGELCTLKQIENTAQVLRTVGMVHLDNIFNFYDLSLATLSETEPSRLAEHPAFAHLSKEKREVLNLLLKGMKNLFKQGAIPLDREALRNYADQVVQLQSVDATIQALKQNPPEDYNYNIVACLPMANDRKEGRKMALLLEQGEKALRPTMLLWLAGKISGLTLKPKGDLADPLTLCLYNLDEVVLRARRQVVKSEPVVPRKEERNLRGKVLPLLVPVAMSLAACAAPDGSPAPTPTAGEAAPYSKEEIAVCGVLGGFGVCEFGEGDIFKSQFPTLLKEFGLTTKEDRDAPVCLIKLGEATGDKTPVFALTQYTKVLNQDTGKKVGSNLPAWVDMSNLEHCYILSAEERPTTESAATAVVESTAIPPADNIILREKPGEWEAGLKHYLGRNFDAWSYDSRVEIDGKQIWVRVINPGYWRESPNPNLAESEQERLAEQVVQDFVSKLTLLKTNFPGTFHPPSVIVLIPSYFSGFCVPQNEASLPPKISVALPTFDKDVIVGFDLKIPYGANTILLPEIERGFGLQFIPSQWCQNVLNRHWVNRAEYHEVTHMVAFAVEVPNPLKEGVAVYGDWMATVVIPPADDLKIVGMSSEDIYSDNWNISAILTAAEESGTWTGEPKQYSIAALAVAALQTADKRFLPEITAISQKEVDQKGGFVQAAQDRISRLNFTEKQIELALWLLGQ